MSKTIRYYRHSETEWNKQGRLQGWLDSPLTQHGVLLAKQIMWKPDVVYCSDLQRAVATANYMFPNDTIHQRAELREIYLGNWQGQWIEQLQHDSHYQCYQETPQYFRAQSQESFSTVTKRMLHVHEQLLASTYENIAVVSHGVALACLFCALRNDSIENLWGYMLTSAAYEAYDWINQ
ncbi:histidine phosphatase family protein [Solibacillus sp. MA9]|uniref:Histidine phosphatase family protein n=1 Tax=Solibacillus palustris TaxID=2908203 RepID=A0ABS9UC77_9BACL|nr:histidine phosphatase family protein [Solibacillus sp. MA9]MCH7321951.1 histidine phosphatase family protein [Solibacillus sp. MA9]